MPSPARRTKGQITVAYDMAGTNWKLSVSDNGIGKPDGVFAQGKSGLGTGIVKALSQQLDAQVETLAGPEGTTVSITHATFPAKNDPGRLNGGHSLAAATNGIGDGTAAARRNPCGRQLKPE